MARYEDAESRLSNALRAKTGAGDEARAAETAERFVATLEVRSPHTNKYKEQKPWIGGLGRF